MGRQFNCRPNWQAKAAPVYVEQASEPMTEDNEPS